MADVNSTQFEPTEKLVPGVLKGRERRAVAIATVASGSPAVSEKIRLFKLPRNAVIKDFWVSNAGTAIATLVLDIGENVASKTDLLMDGADLTTSTKHLKSSDAEQGTNGYYALGAEAGAELWAILDYTVATDADQEITIDATAATGATGAGTVVVVCTYVVD